MINYEDLKNYKLFIHDYFNLGYRWDEIEMALDNFVLCEPDESPKEFLKEIKYIQEEADWKDIEEINEKVGGIYYDEERNNQMLEIIKKYIYQRLEVQE